MPDSATKKRRIGIFGGTFDPVHMGHLIVAEQCREAGKLDEVWFMPAFKQPFKQTLNITNFEQRVEMLKLAIAGYPVFQINEIEQQLPPPSYTANTLEQLHKQHPNVEFFMLIGSDSLADLPDWHEPLRIVRAVSLLVMLRAEPGKVPTLGASAELAPHTVETFKPMKRTLETLDDLRTALEMPAGEPLHIEWVQTPPLIDLSSHDLKRRVSEGRSIRYLVPHAVERYIVEKKLYRG